MSTSSVRSVLANSTKFTVLATSSALLLSSLTAPAAVAVDTATPSGSAADYVQKQITAGEGHIAGDAGANIDAAFALAAGGATKDEAAPLLGHINGSLGAYVQDAQTGAYKAGALGKALLYADLAGENASSVGGVDVAGELAKLRQADGSYLTKTGATSKEGTFSQALIVLGLFRAGMLDGGATNPAVTYLASLQCTNGGFGFGAPAADGSCAADADMTGLAVQALATAGKTDAATRGAQQLAGSMDAQGGVASFFGGANSNSTALAAMAFADVKDQANLNKAVGFVKSLQLGAEAPEAVRGGVVYQADRKTTTTAPNDELTRSTTQAAVALAGKSYATTEFATTPSNPSDPAPSDPADPNTPGDSAEGSTGSLSTGGIIGIIVAVLGALGLGFLALNPQLLPKF